MKTPEQIAPETVEALTIDNDDHAATASEPRTSVEDVIRRAANADRAKRSSRAQADRYFRSRGFDNLLAATLYDCLSDRETPEATAAAQWVADNENDALWDRFVGPMLDDIEQVAAL